MATDGVHGAGAPPPGCEGPQDLRYEVKLVAEEALADELLATLRLSSVALREAYPPRVVQSLYLDTHEGAALEDNLSGQSAREKLRVRWYGSSARGVSAVLEAKCRKHRLGWKERVPLPGPLDIEGGSRRGLLAGWRQALDPEWAERLSGDLEIVQWIRYERQYLQSADDRVRVTLDRHLMAFDQRYRLSLASRGGRPIPGIVVECKAAPADHGALVELVGGLPLVVDRCSKFARGLSDEAAPLLSYGRR